MYCIKWNHKLKLHVLTLAAMPNLGFFSKYNPPKTLPQPSSTSCLLFYKWEHRVFLILSGFFPFVWVTSGRPSSQNLTQVTFPLVSMGGLPMWALQYFSWYLHEIKECVTGMRNNLGKRMRVNAVLKRDGEQRRRILMSGALCKILPLFHLCNFSLLNRKSFELESNI